jgi:hypothetical protein
MAHLPQPTGALDNLTRFRTFQERALQSPKSVVVQVVLPESSKSRQLDEHGLHR